MCFEDSLIELFGFVYAPTCSSEVFVTYWLYPLNRNMNNYDE